MFVRREYFLWLEPSSGDSQTTIFLQSMTIQSRLNEIPVAIVSVVFGKNFSTENDDNAADSLELIEQWAANATAVRIRSQIKEFALDDESPVIRDVTMFEGYIMAPSIQFSRQSADYTFQIHHWLRDITAGSMLAHMAITTQATRSQSPIFQQQAQSMADDPDAFTLDKFFGFGTGIVEDVVKDIWGGGFKKILAKFATTLIDEEAARAFQSCSSNFNQPSQALRNAIGRIQGPLQGDDIAAMSREYSGGGAPVAFRSTIAESDRSFLADQIVAAVGKRTLHDFAEADFWDAMLSFCADYGVVIVPRATDAIVLPLYTSRDMKDTQPDIIESDEAEISWTGFQQSEIRGVLCATADAATNNFMYNLDSTGDPAIVGCFIASDDIEKGQVRLENPPSWLSVLPDQDAKSETVTAKASGSNGVGQVGEASSEKAQELKSYVDDNYAAILNAYAKMRYITHNLTRRVLSVNCPIRFDIGLGSVVKIRLNASNMTSRVAIPVQNLTGMVVGVMYTIDRRSKAASTVFHLDSVRNQKQLEDTALVQTEHPFFETTPRIIPFAS